MMQCYYDVLGVPRNADDVAIKKAYRRLAMRCHPDVDGGNAAEFARICEAYDVLSTASNKGVYDLHGADVLKSSSDGGGGYSFDPRHGPAAIFSRFFGTANPYEALSALSAHFERLTTATKVQPGAVREVELLVSLEDVARGATKVVRHHRRAAGEAAAGGGSSVVLQPVELKVQVKPGQLEGSRYVFEGQGDAVAQGVPPGQLVLVLASAPHPRFRRQGPSDLVARVKLPLVNALAGGCVRLDTLDGRVLSVPLDEVVTPGLVVKVPGEGLPLPGAAGCSSIRGDLHLEFELQFPSRLSSQQKMLLRAGLFLPARPDTAAAKALRELEAAFQDAQHGWASGVVKSAGAPGAMDAATAAATAAFTS